MPDTQTAVDTASQEHAMSPESVVGYLHSTERAGWMGLACALSSFTSGRQFRCLYCHNPDT